MHEYLHKYLKNWKLEIFVIRNMRPTARPGRDLLPALDKTKLFESGTDWYILILRIWDRLFQLLDVAVTLAEEYNFTVVYDTVYLPKKVSKRQSSHHLDNRFRIYNAETIQRQTETETETEAAYFGLDTKTMLKGM